MTTGKHLTIIATILAALGLCNQGRAAVVMNAVESGNDVIVTGSGSFNIAAFGSTGVGFFTENLDPSAAIIAIGVQGPDTGSAFGGPVDNFVAPANFGAGLAIDASSGTGDIFGLVENSILFVPANYQSGTPLAGTTTFAGQDFASLGMDPGTYVWSWGNGADADSMTLNIIPEPSTHLLALLGLAAGLLRRRR